MFKVHWIYIVYVDILSTAFLFAHGLRKKYMFTLYSKFVFVDILIHGLADEEQIRGGWELVISFNM